MKCTSQVTCHHPGCTKTGFYEYDSRKEQYEAFSRRQKWMCNRHTNPERILSAENRVREEIMVSARDEELGHNYWGIQGYVSGPGFAAYCDDFPPGTKLIVTAKIELPETKDDSERVKGRAGV